MAEPRTTRRHRAHRRLRRQGRSALSGCDPRGWRDREYRTRRRAQWRLSLARSRDPVHAIQWCPAIGLRPVPNRNRWLRPFRALPMGRVGTPFWRRCTLPQLAQQCLLRGRRPGNRHLRLRGLPRCSRRRFRRPGVGRSRRTHRHIPGELAVRLGRPWGKESRLCRGKPR